MNLPGVITNVMYTLTTVNCTIKEMLYTVFKVEKTGTTIYV